MAATNVHKNTYLTRISWRELALLVALVVLGGWLVGVDDILDPPDGSASEVEVRAPWHFSRAEHE